MSLNEDSFFKNIVRYIYHRKKFFGVLVVMLLILTYAVFGKKGILQRVNLEFENRELHEKNKIEQQKTQSLQKEIQDLKTSDKKIEEVAREKYGMVKDGEEIYKVVVDSTK